MVEREKREQKIFLTLHQVDHGQQESPPRRISQKRSSTAEGLQSEAEAGRALAGDLSPRGRN